MEEKTDMSKTDTWPETPDPPPSYEGTAAELPSYEKAVSDNNTSLTMEEKKDMSKTETWPETPDPPPSYEGTAAELPSYEKAVSDVWTLNAVVDVSDNNTSLTMEEKTDMSKTETWPETPDPPPSYEGTEAELPSYEKAVSDVWTLDAVVAVSDNNTSLSMEEKNDMSKTDTWPETPDPPPSYEGTEAELPSYEKAVSDVWTLDAVVAVSDNNTSLSMEEKNDMSKTDTWPETPDPPPSYEGTEAELPSYEKAVSDVWTLDAVVAVSVMGLIFIGVTVAHPVSMIVMGAIHLHDCQAERFIPIYLVVGGSFGLFQSFCDMCKRRKARKQQQSSECGEDDGSRNSCLSGFSRLVSGLVPCFLFAWFIAGNVWVYRTYNAWSPLEGADDYCHPTLYWYSFWLITATYIFIGACLLLFTVVGCCFCFVAKIISSRSRRRSRGKSLAA